MRIYFISQEPSALKLNGIYVGILDKSEQFIDIDLSQSIFCEIVPANPKLVSINFIVNQHFLDSPPEFIEVFDLLTCYKVCVATFSSVSTKLNVAWQNKLDDGTLITLFSEQGARLMLENSSGFLYQDVPPSFVIESCTLQEFMGENIILVQGQAVQKVLFIFLQNPLKLLFKNNCQGFKLSSTLDVTFAFNDIAKHIAVSSWALQNQSLVMTNYTVSDSLNIDTLNPSIIPYCFFEEVLCGGNPKKFLSSSLQPRVEHLKEYLGIFVDIIPPPHNVSSDYIGLIYKVSPNKFVAKYFKAQMQNREIINILPYSP